MNTNTSHSTPQANPGTSSAPGTTNRPPTASASTPPLITLELIAQRKAQKLEEVRQAKAQMSDTLRQLFAPVEHKGGMEGIMQHVNTGIAVYDGVRTGIKIMQRIRSLFMLRKRR